MEEKKKVNVKRILFCISLMPYIFFLGWGIFNFINDGNYWLHSVFNFNPFSVCLAIFCIVYPIYYLIDKPSKGKEKTSVIIKKLIFYLAMMPHLIFFVVGIYRCFFLHHYLRLYGLWEPIDYFWQFIEGFEIMHYGICLAIFWIVYPVYYFIDRFKRKNYIQEDVDSSKSKEKKAFILYNISLIPYFWFISCTIGYFGGLGIDFILTLAIILTIIYMITFKRVK